MSIYYPRARTHIIWWPYLTSPGELGEIAEAFNKAAPAQGDSERTVARALEQLIAISNVEPRSVSVEHNDVFTADTFEVELDEYLFRIDPRNVRAFMADIRMGSVSAADDTLAVGSDDPRQLYGHADAITQSYQTDGASTITAKGRDYTGLLLDEDWQGRRLELARPLSELIAEAIEPVPALAPLEIALAPGLVDPVIPAGKRRRDRFFSVSPETSLWEGLLELTMRAGVMLVVEVDKLIIQPPRNVQTDDQTTTPVFIEGRNLRELTIERNLGTADLPSVQISSYSREEARSVHGIWPPARKEARLTKGKRSEKQSVQRFFVNVASPTIESLAEIAKHVFSLYARQQLEISFSTTHMAVGVEHFERRDFASPEMPTTAIRNGSAVRVRLQPEERSMLAKGFSRSKTERELRAMGYEPQVAAMLARSWEPIEHLLFTSTATHRFQGGDYSLSVRAQNFITIG